MHDTHHELARDARLAFDALWPRRQSPDDAAQWIERLAQVLAPIPLDACWVAVDEWCDTETRWPSPVDLAQMARRLRAKAEPERPPVIGVASASFARAHIEAMRAINRIRSESLDAHDHHQGPESCPVCTTVPGKVAEVLADLPEPSAMVSRCRMCPGSGWEELADGSVRPCEACNADGFDAWEQGYSGRRQRWAS